MAIKLTTPHWGKDLSSWCCSSIPVTNSLSRQRQWVNPDTSCWKPSIKYSVFPSASASSGISNRTGTQYSCKRSSNCCHFKKDILKQMPTNTLGTCVKSGRYSCLSSPSLPHSLNPPPYSQFCPPPLSPTHVPYCIVWARPDCEKVMLAGKGCPVPV